MKTFQNIRPLFLAFSCLALLTLNKIALASAPLPSALSAALSKAQVPPEAVSIWAQALDATSPTLSLNESMPMNPASVMKLPTTYAAFEKLGSTYAWQTRLASDGTIANGKLQGNLYLVGTGDPTFYYEHLWKMLRQLRQLGVQEIAGSIFLDNTALKLPAFDPGQFDQKSLRPYNAGPDGLLINFNALRISLLPTPGAGQPTILFDPPLAGLKVVNQVRTEPGACGLWFKNLDAKLDAQGGARTLTLSGTWHDECGPKDWEVAPLASPDYAATLITSLWAELGGKIQGKFFIGAAPANSKTLLTHSSAPLANAIRDMNKWSNNQIARQIQVTLGREADPTHLDMAERGNLAILSSLNENGISTAGWEVGNGAGLSRQSRLTAKGLGAMLVSVWNKPYMGEFLASLPIAGEDGTAYRRLKGSAAQGRAWLKTGTIDDVSAIAGYVQDKNNRRWAIVMIANHPNALNTRAAQDVFVNWVWNAGN